MSGIEPNGIDRLVSKLLTYYGQQTPRRQVLKMLASVTLSALGIAVVQAVPVNRATAIEECDCNDTQYCGLCGRFCTACPGGGCESCPTGTTRGSFWAKCCNDQVEYRYYDCCQTGTVPACCGQGPACCRGSGQPAWCGGAGNYCCTIVEAGSPCPI
jgi:hypothetical protein